MTSIRKIAEIAGVSTSTAFRALRGDPHVLPAKREQVLMVAAMYDYRPCRNTPEAGTGANGTIGCILPHIAGPFFSRVSEGILEEAYMASYHVLTLQVRCDVLRVRKAIQSLVEHRVVGLLIATGMTEPIPSASAYALLSNRILPVAMDATSSEVPVDCVRTNEEDLAAIALEYLTGLGHRRIAYLGDLGAGRGRAMQRAMERHHLPPLLFHDVNDSRTQESVMRILKAQHDRPTAIIAMDDHLAAVIIQCAGRMGLQVPRDLSVMGCGAHFFSSFTIPPITTIDQDPVMIGRTAFRLALQRIEEQTDPSAWERTLVEVPNTLIVRESCAPPPALRKGVPRRHVADPRAGRGQQ